jgi:hypothetical protein
MTMTMTSRRGLALILTGALVAPFSPVTRVWAVDKAECVAAYEATQTLRKEGALVEAREKALSCAQDGCPAVIRDDCTAWVSDIEKSTPSIVLSVSDGTGKDVIDVTVSIDGKVVKEKLDGKSIPLDPGSHKLHLESPGLPAYDQDVVAREGEKNRAIVVKLGGDNTADVGGDKTPTAVDRPTPASVYALGAVGIVGLGAFTAFALMGNAKKSDLDSQNCKPNCAQSDVDSIKSKYLLADISLGVGVVALGAATVLYLTRSEVPAPSTSTGFTLDVKPLVGGGYGNVAFQF